MTKTITYTCEVVVMQTKDLDTNASDLTCMVDILCDDPETQKQIDTSTEVSLASTGQYLSLAVASIVVEESVKRGVSTHQMLAEFIHHVSRHIVTHDERVDPDIFNFDINS